jgi:hypothetical protein
VDIGETPDDGGGELYQFAVPYGKTENCCRIVESTKE